MTEQCSGGTLLAPASAPFHGSGYATHAPGPAGPSVSLYNPQGPATLPPPLGPHPASRFYPPPILYWTYPSPPVSPTNYFTSAIATHTGQLQAQSTHQQALIPADCIPIATSLNPLQAAPIEVANAHGHRTAEHDKHGVGQPHRAAQGLLPAQGAGPFPAPHNYVEIFMA